MYIALPEEDARAGMLKIHMGDAVDKATGAQLHSLVPSDYAELAKMTQWYSGSDISAACKAVMMEPLRKCRQAKLWRREADGRYYPLPLSVALPAVGAAAAAAGSRGAEAGAGATAVAHEDLAVPFCAHERHPRLPGDPCYSAAAPWAEPAMPAGQLISDVLCPGCGCVYIATMYNLTTEQLGVPCVDRDDVVRVLTKSRGSVGKTELAEYEKFVNEFGEEGK